MTRNNPVSNKITYYSFFMAIGIVVFHSKGTHGFTLIEGVNYDVVNIVLDFIGVTALGFFFMVSGFLLYRNSNTAIERRRKISNRLKVSLLPPYIVWNSLGLLYTIISSLLITGDKLSFSAPSIIQGYTLFPYNGPLWYMFALLVLLICLPLLGKTLVKRTWLLIIIAVTIASYIFPILLHGNSSPYITWMVRLIHYLPLYFWGAFLGKFYDNDIFDATYENNVFYMVFGGALFGLSMCYIIGMEMDFSAS